MTAIGPAHSDDGDTGRGGPVGVRPGATVERIDLGDGAWVDVARGWLEGADELFVALRDTVCWTRGRMWRYDHWEPERRLSAGWRRGRPLPHPGIGVAHRALEARYGVRFDGCAMIRYRDGRDGQAFHRDTDMRWLEDTLIAIVSVGARRPWLLRPHRRRFDHGPDRGAEWDLAPGPGDLIVMGGRCQATWEHSVPYLGGRPVGERISIQWRHVRRVGRPWTLPSWRAPRTWSR